MNMVHYRKHYDLGSDVVTARMWTPGNTGHTGHTGHTAAVVTGHWSGWWQGLLP